MELFNVGSVFRDVRLLLVSFVAVAAITAVHPAHHPVRTPAVQRAEVRSAQAPAAEVALR